MLRIPVLMYHNISKNHDISFGLTLSAIKFEEQLQYLVKKKYKSFFVSELEQMNNVMGNSVLLTFDDVTENQLLYALPLLKKHNIKATFFVPFSYLGMTDLWNKGSEATGERIMTIEQLKSLDSDFIELGHHSYLHRKYTDLSIDEIQDDFNKSFEMISKNDLKVYPALAYPYGNYPKKGILKDDFLKLLQKNNIKMAFRIGNRVNSFPFKKIFEIQRIDIKGEDSLFTFKLKLRFGKLKLF